MKSSSVLSWVILALAAIYFFVPLFATLEFAMRQLPDSGFTFMFLGRKHSFDAFVTSIVSPDFQLAFLRSALLAIASIVGGILLVVPTVYLIRLKLPQWRSPVEFVTLLPLVIPAIIIVFGYTRLWIVPSWSPFKTGLATDVLLAVGYVTLALPYMYRSVDTGMRAIDIKTLTEAAQSLGASGFTILFRVILPNVRSAVLGGAFVTFAIVIGEYTFASLLGREVFGTYLQRIGANEAYEPSALALIAFAITWACMGLIQFVGRAPGARPAR
ncbi:ABC transporter permease [Labrys monachus]|uniref:Spermidine/putrescine transport system permease protein n=1 Tax=Labrys monachus TaxID=217067 RepID=A0ABU0F877_9HYPH|nr:ABC transporter permease [Labrys monachus]MDQ0390822.1 putative spermidine/putrescine transport system permease protein [Labrys monachus]